MGITATSGITFGNGISITSPAAVRTLTQTGSVSSFAYTTLLGHTSVHCLKSLTAAYGWVVLIPNVAGRSTNATKHHKL